MINYSKFDKKKIEPLSQFILVCFSLTAYCLYRIKISENNTVKIKLKALLIHLGTLQQF